jgi:hypothetical protein
MRSLHGGFHKILDETDMSQIFHYSIVYYIVPLKSVTWLVRMDCENEDKKTVDLALSVVDKM